MVVAPPSRLPAIRYEVAATVRNIGTILQDNSERGAALRLQFLRYYRPDLLPFYREGTTTS